MMFVSADNPKTGRATVLCNGKPLSYCYAADSDLGIALCFAVNEKGKVYADHETKNFKKNLVQGKIEILNIKERRQC